MTKPFNEIFIKLSKLIICCIQGFIINPGIAKGAFDSKNKIPNVTFGKKKDNHGRAVSINHFQSSIELRIRFISQGGIPDILSRGGTCSVFLAGWQLLLKANSYKY